MSGPLKSDVAARVARERAELASATRDAPLALEAADMHSELYRHGYRLSVLGDATGIAPRPVHLRARHAVSCSMCRQTIPVDAPIVWMLGEPGVRCASCGGVQHG